ncbi:calcium dependent mitochondrial carrier protein [Metarhizium album ARSEF 1941]|uniref:Mitochondrial thiamine pyrophosphate carrier 1 n=1 Tax=Metarhizium album (strain ARSEF 1941) TaxID=1081103 RepID=A0A0B2WW24_METAS|nr:calcium dependent mitochondrial carrier protein [Metarhizium album ARSEF 1941]KHN97784.1 calcium dependent mitochondrial carrier protein [Metarhizium album ARSEF 1941]
MSTPKLVTAAKPRLQESPDEREARVERLWSRLDPAGKGELDLKGLQKGFRRIDHPLKNANNLLKQIMKEVDTNHDGKIQFEALSACVARHTNAVPDIYAAHPVEFRNFVEKTERQLLLLFQAIDKDGNGKLDAAELQTAFRTAGLSVSNRRVADFFHDLDRNNDGFVSFEEWRNFLLFMPACEHDSQLQAVLSYYDSVVSVTPEGDSLVSDETLEGLVRVASALPSPAGSSSGSPTGPVRDSTAPTCTDADADAVHVPPKPGMNAVASAHEERDSVPSTTTKRRRLVATKPTRLEPSTPTQSTQHVGDGTSKEHMEEPSQSWAGVEIRTRQKFKLTDFAPDPGYFLAGAIAGGVSRTATAPLDRLKVYLLVNTSTSPETAVAAITQGRPIAAAVKNALRPISDAVGDLFRNGGIRSFFAGNGLNVIKIMPETAIKFGSYEAAKRALANLEGHGDARNVKSYSKFTAGGVAGMIAQFCVYPLDTLKFRLQCETVKGGPTGSALVRQTAVKMYADGGVRACYRGVTMGLVGMFPYSAIDMAMFELLKNSYRTYYARYAGCNEEDANPGNIATGIIGATSGGFGATVVYPLNVVRTRLQTQGTVMHRATYTGIWDVAQKTIQKEGYRGLYKGLSPNLLKVAPALSITWVVYENSKSVLGLQ